MNVYAQDPEVGLLSRLLTQLDPPIVIDVGAELGSIAEQMLRAGAATVHAFDPHPDNANALRAHFASDQRVTVHECAVSDREGSGELHVSRDHNGTILPFGHTLLERDNTAEIEWRETISVKLSTLGGLIEAGEIPRRVGILKIDTEGHDLAVVRGLGPLEPRVVMVEHWTHLPNGLGACPWTPEEMVAAFKSRGFTHFAFIVHREEFVTLKWDDATVERGAMGNLFFLHDSVVDRLLPAVLECAGSLAEHAVAIGRRYMHAAGERLAMVDELKRVATDRLSLADELKQAADDRLKLVDELSALAQERLEALQAAHAELERLGSELEKH